ncbi:class I SAM-dependent methyltransferase [Kineococcus siccus]|uniref:class I SAM-dependent methyltransferase n=1 Tax=Kineococcus siccus TaxID=2696567 RepID=UPI0030B84A8A
MGLISVVGPGLVVLGVVALPVLAAVRRRSWSRWAAAFYVLSLALLFVWTAKSIVIADSSFDDPPAWPALPWLLAAVLAAAIAVATLPRRRERGRSSRPAESPCVLFSPATRHACRDDAAGGQVLDVGCGTGTFALLLSRRGCDVIAVDPAAASVEVAQGKPGAQHVRWQVGDATSVQVDDRDLVTMTANTAQLIVEPEAWASTLEACRAALVPGGHLVFETRRRSARAWEGWTAQQTRRTTHVDGVGAVHSHVETVAVEDALVTFRWRYVLPDARGGSETLTSTSTLRFREEAELEDDLRRAGLDVLDVREAPDRPGQELVVLARNRRT